MVNFKVALSALALAGVANAVIDTIVPHTKPFTVTTTSKLPVTFTTHTSPTSAQDFTVVFGITPAKYKVTGQELGSRPLQAFNLLHLYPTPPSGNFTLHVTLTKDQVSIFEPGRFTITAAATTGFGANYGTDVYFFSENITLHW